MPVGTIDPDTTSERAPAWFQAVVEHAYDVILVTGPDRSITYASPSVLRVLGYRPEELLGTSGFGSVHPEDRRTVSDRLAALRRGDGSASSTLEVRVRHRDGSWRWLEYVLTDLLDDPSVGGVVANIRDVTARKETEESLRANEARMTELHALNERVVGMTSHELRDPVTAIAGFSELLDRLWDELPDIEKRDFVRRVHIHATRLAGIIADLLLLAQGQSGALQLDLASCSIADAAREVIAACTSAPAEVDVTCPPSLYARADARRLNQILCNLLTNARRYGAAPFSIEAHRTDHAVEIRVGDRGPGVPPEFVPRLFEPFSRAPRTSAPSPCGGKGVGLGLSIVRQLAEAQGGEVWYEAHPDGGATFGVRLPATEPR